MLLIPIARRLGRLWYHLTAYVPRLLPATQDEYERVKAVLVHAYDVPDEPQIWVLVAGQIVSHDPYKRRKAWGHIANAAKKLRVMNLAMGHKHAALEELNAKLKDAIERESARLNQEAADESKSQVIPDADAKQAGEVLSQNTASEAG